MSPVESISLFFQNYVNFQGRSRRAEFWWPFLMNFVIFFMLGFIGAIMSGGETVNGLPAGPALIIITLQIVRRFASYPVDQEVIKTLALIMTVAMQINLFFVAAELFTELFAECLDLGNQPRQVLLRTVDTGA